MDLTRKAIWVDQSGRDLTTVKDINLALMLLADWQAITRAIADQARTIRIPGIW